ncbi:MAG: hypothetical protein LDL26_03575 [Caenispirillum bisanense]|nr:hypothetical protein [Caenispirillum bisanense]MCA1972315.1 hypothetical protein [Caenispirillum sp.]
MALTRINLHKLLALMYAPINIRRRVILEEIAADERRARGEVSSGGDFYAPFWKDAKTHMAGEGDLRALTAARIAANNRRRNLYPLLEEGFLSWWNERRRWINEPFALIDANITRNFEIPALSATIKIHSAVRIRIGDREDRILYPYFREIPILGQEAA